MSNYTVLKLFFESEEELIVLTNKEINNVLKVLNRPGFLNGIDLIYIDKYALNGTSFNKIKSGIKCHNMTITNYYPINIARNSRSVLFYRAKEGCSFSHIKDIFRI